MRHRRRQLLVAARVPLLSGLAPGQERQRRIACLFGGSPRSHSRMLDAFRSGLNERGWVEGRNIMVDVRWAEGLLTLRQQTMWRGF